MPVTPTTPNNSTGADLSAPDAFMQQRKQQTDASSAPDMSDPDVFMSARHGPGDDASVDSSPSPSIPTIPPLSTTTPAQTAAPRPPGFLARLSESTLGTEHPFDDTVNATKKMFTDPKGFATDVYGHGKQFVEGLNDLGTGLVTHPIDTIKNVTGGTQFEEDARNKNYRGAAGDLTGAGVNAALMASGDRVGAPGSVEEASQLALKGGAKAAQGAEAAAKVPIGSSVPSVIANAAIPRTASQAGTVPASVGSFEHMIGSVPVIGKPLADIYSGQAKVPEKVLTTLSGADRNIEGQPFSSRYNVAAEATRAQATPMYESLNNVPVPEARAAANVILNTDEINAVLDPKTRQSLINVAAGGTEEWIRKKPP